MLFNNFVEGSLKLKPFDVHITQTIVKKIKMKAFIFFLQIAQLIETSYLYMYSLTNFSQILRCIKSF